MKCLIHNKIPFLLVACPIFPLKVWVSLPNEWSLTCAPIGFQSNVLLLSWFSDSDIYAEIPDSTEDTESE